MCDAFERNVCDFWKSKKKKKRFINELDTAIKKVEYTNEV